MRKMRTTARIKPGRFLAIPLIALKRPHVSAGDQVDVTVTAHGRIEVTKVLTPAEKRIIDFRERLRVGSQRRRFALSLAAIPNAGEDDDFSRV
ncbi:hypothetical protein C664_08773 [Thauera sp. 63]|nr:hypothetical protein C664_08773 [Thauera sp. 63]